MATSSRFTAVGAFVDRAHAENALRELQHAGFDVDRIGIAVGGAPAQEPGAGNGTRGTVEKIAATGAAAGAALGALTGAAATGLIPGLGPMLAAGVTAGILGGTALGAAAGGIVGALFGFGLPEEEARYYDREFAAGRIIIAVQAGNRSVEAADILRRCGAHRASAAESAQIGKDSGKESDAPKSPPS